MSSVQFIDLKCNVAHTLILKYPLMSPNGRQHIIFMLCKIFTSSISLFKTCNSKNDPVLKTCLTNRFSKKCTLYPH